jgi:hypothetical protein
MIMWNHESVLEEWKGSPLARLIRVLLLAQQLADFSQWPEPLEVLVPGNYGEQMEAVLGLDGGN